MIKIDIQEIKNVDDIETFFALLCEENILFHPEISFHEFVTCDKNTQESIPLFSWDESERLDYLMIKCYAVADEACVNLMTIALRISESFWGKSPNSFH
jgi:hypothetical protein